MILDYNYQFDPTGTDVTVTADSTNSIDLGANRDMGIGEEQLMVLVLATATFTSATASATMTISVSGAPDNGGVAGTFTTIGTTPALPLGFLHAGYKIAQFNLPPIADSPVPVAVPLLTTTASSTSATVSSATGIVQGQEIVSAGLVPGTTVSSISGTTVTLSTAAASTTSAVSSAFMGAPQPYRFLKLTYTCSNTMTAGSVNAFLCTDDIDNVVFYKPGIAVAN